MRVCVYLFVLLCCLFGGCYKAQLDHANDQLERLRDSLRLASERYQRLNMDFDGLSLELSQSVEAAVSSDAISIILDAHSFGYTDVSFSDFNLSFSLSTGGVFAQGEFCSDDIPIAINAEKYLELTPSRRLQLLYHEFGHSYFNYAHPDELPPEISEAQPAFDHDIMHSSLWLNDNDDLAHFHWARARFWTGHYYHIVPCATQRADAGFFCPRH